MTSLLLSTLIFIIRKLIPGDIVDHLRALVVIASNTGLSGPSKRLKVLAELNAISEVSEELRNVESWLINMALEVFVGWVKHYYPKTAELLVPKF